MELMQANRQWSTRPSDERFESMEALAAFTAYQRNNSARRVVSNRGLTVVPSTTDPYDIAVTGPNGNPAQFSHWAFTQYAARAGVPSGYLRDSRMPGALIADNLNWGMQHARDVESVSVMLRRQPDGATSLAAVNGPDYGVVWNADIASTLVSCFGNSQWRVPGEFGKAVEVTKENTTLYASDRDMWAFLADEERRIAVDNRRDGRSGTLARGFYISNSEVGASTLLLGMFLFDYACSNRIIWGAQQFHEIRIRHTAGAPYRWAEEIKPILRQYAESSPADVEHTIAAAQQAKISGDVTEFLATRFGKGAAGLIIAAHDQDEHKPMETIFDVVTGATAYARTIDHVDRRVKVERIAGDLLAKVA